MKLFHDEMYFPYTPAIVHNGDSYHHNIYLNKVSCIRKKKNTLYNCLLLKFLFFSFQLISTSFDFMVSIVEKKFEDFQRVFQAVVLT